MPAQRDPVSLMFDQGARTLLARAYARPGQWVGTLLADPSAEHRAYFLAVHGIDVAGPDNAPTASGRRLRAWSRWGRGFTRAVYYQHRWYSQIGGGTWRRERRTVARTAGALELEFGRHRPAAGIFPAGRAVRARLRPGGGKALAAVKRLDDDERIYDDQGAPAGRYSVLAGRDW